MPRTGESRTISWIPALAEMMGVSGAVLLIIGVRLMFYRLP
jgi:hypothetical protein